MNCRLFALIAVAALVLAAPCHAQDKYTLKIKELGEGDAARVEIKDATTFKSTTTIEKRKEPKVEEHTGSKHLLYTEAILARPAGAALPTKVRRTYQTAAVKGTGGPFGQKDFVPPYNGKTLLIEKKGTAYEFRIEGGAILDKEAPELAEEFTSGGAARSKKAFLPPGPVAVGEIWKVDPKDFGIEPGKVEGMQVLKSEAKAKLVKVHKKDGRLFGVVETVVDLHMKTVPPAAKKADGPAMEIVAAVRFVFEGCIDGTLAEGKMSGAAEMNSMSSQVVPDVGMVSTSGRNSSTGEYSWQELPKK